MLALSSSIIVILLIDMLIQNISLLHYDFILCFSYCEAVCLNLTSGVVEGSF